MKDNNLTYHKSGVNIKGADRFVDYISKKAKNQTKSSNLRSGSLCGDSYAFTYCSKWASPSNKSNFFE